LANKCPKCHSENPDTQRFCGGCGTPLPLPKDHPPVVTETLQTPVHELTTGSTFAGRYQVIEELGHGGMGRVYKVQDTKIGEKIALKIIRYEAGLDAMNLERFSNEIKFARKIRHKNVCQMFDLGEDKGTRYITMEYVHGEDLKQLIRKVGRLSPGQAIGIARQVCEGLEEAHRLGFVHRDLKPQNIMLDEDGNARIMDFGIARSLSGRGITGVGVMIGTPEYMSPEQVEGKEVDARSDIYSLGIILYELVTGQVPFDGDTPFAVGMKQKSEIPKDPGEFNSLISKDLSLVIMRCLEKAKEKRYQCADELDSELATIEQEMPTAERSFPIKKLVRTRGVAAEIYKSRWIKIGLYGGAVVILALIAYAGLTLFTGRQELIDSIAVLPFENVKADPNLDYLCEGIPEAINNKLSRVFEFKKIIARNSVITYKGRTVDAKRVGQELGVKAVLLTRLVRIGDQLTINPTLVRTRDNSQLWGDKYAREVGDILAIEDDISTSIVRALRLKISGEEKKKILKRPIDNEAAYECYLRASYEIRRFTEGSLDRAVQFLQQGIDIIGENALLYAGLAQAYYRYVDVGLKQEDYITKAEDWVNKALALDPDIPQAHWLLGSINRDFRGNPREAIRHYKKALAVDPNEPDTLVNLVFCYCVVGRTSAARRWAERAEQIDPLNLPPHSSGAKPVLFEGQFRTALEQYRSVYQSDPNKFSNQLWMSLILMYNDRLEEAAVIIDRMVQAQPTALFTRTYLLLEHALLKEKKEALELMTPDFFAWCQRDPFYSYWAAAIYALIEKRNEALDWLENAVDRGFINYRFLAEKDPFLNNIREEERFKKLMERVKYEWEHFEE
jgi:serine/threonine protein kinase/tetratricopeptide (TPR) repeat protein